MIYKHFIREEHISLYIILRSILRFYQILWTQKLDAKIDYKVVVSLKDNNGFKICCKTAEFRCIHFFFTIILVYIPD